KKWKTERISLFNFPFLYLVDIFLQSCRSASLRASFHSGFLDCTKSAGNINHVVNAAAFQDRRRYYGTVSTSTMDVKCFFLRKFRQVVVQEIKRCALPLGQVFTVEFSWLAHVKNRMIVAFNTFLE